MKCKYCDYENPKDAIVCECCGATLATQKSIEFYKKEARKKIRRRGEKTKRVKEKKEKYKKASEDSEGYAEKKKAFWRCLIGKKTIIPAAALLLAVILTVTAIELFPVNTSKYERFYGEEQEQAVAVYDPESCEYSFFMNGKRLEQTIYSELGFSLELFSQGVTVFSADAKNSDGSKYSSFIVISEHGLKSFDVQGVETDICQFNVLSGGDSFILTVKLDSKCYLYSCCLDGEGTLYLVNSYSTAPNIIDISDYPCDTVFLSCKESGTYKYNCRTNDLTEVSKSRQVRSTQCSSGAGIVMEMIDSKSYSSDSVVTNYIYYRADTDMMTELTDIKEIVISPDGKTVAYSLSEDTFVYKDREHIYVGDFAVMSVSDGGEVIYGYDSETKTLFSSNLQGEVKVLAEGATQTVLNEKRNELLFILEEGLYLSQNGNYSIKIEGHVTFVSKTSKCEDSFVGGLLSINSNEKKYLCILDKSYKLVPQIINAMSSRVFSEDGKTGLYLISSGIYKYEEGVDKELEFICPLTGGIRYYLSSDMNGAYNFGSTVFYADSRNVNTVTGDIFGWNMFKGILIVKKKDDYTNTVIYDVASDAGESEDETEDTEKENEENINKFSFYYSVNGGRLKTLKKNAALCLTTNNTIYVYVQRENTGEDKTDLYDVYAGSDPGHIKLVASGVLRVS